MLKDDNTYTSRLSLDVPLFITLTESASSLFYRLEISEEKNFLKSEKILSRTLLELVSIEHAAMYAN